MKRDFVTISEVQLCLYLCADCIWSDKFVSDQRLQPYGHKISLFLNSGNTDSICSVTPIDKPP